MDQPLSIYVPYNDPALTRQALHEALAMSNGLGPTITVLGVWLLPFPAQLEWPEATEDHLREIVSAVAAGLSDGIQVKLVLARCIEDAYLQAVPEDSLVVIGTRRRWWWTREQRLARTLRRCGFETALVQLSGGR